jgi:hypothetical protein
MPGAAAAGIRCREICATDLETVTLLLEQGFRKRHRRFWQRALARMTEHPTPSGFPKYGYLLEAAGAPVGVLLLIFSADGAEKPAIQCYVSSWYTAPAYRSYATIITSYALKFKEVTYVNVTPAPHTWPILEAQGWRRYCDGRFVALPALGAQSRDDDARLTTLDKGSAHLLPPAEVELLSRHAAYGCVSVICTTADGSYPFVFLRHREIKVLPCAYLAYCRDLADFVRFARPLGRFLAKRGVLMVVLDASAPVDGLIGWYVAGAPKYYKGPQRPALGNIAYSERVMFGF